MKCYFHKDIDAQNICSKCQKNICRKCTIKMDNTIVCKDCAVEKLSLKREAKNNVKQENDANTKYLKSKVKTEYRNVDKNPILLLLLSSFPGFNYIYLELYNRGLFFIAISIFSFFIFISTWSFIMLNILVFIFIYALVDSFRKRVKIIKKIPIEDGINDIFRFSFINKHFLLIFCILILIIITSNFFIQSLRIIFRGQLISLFFVQFINTLAAFSIIAFFILSLILLIKLIKNTSNTNISVEHLNKEPEVEEIFNDNEILSQMKEYENYLRNTEMYSYIHEIIKTSTKILNFEDESKEKTKDINKFKEYYLPTTLNLIKTYYQINKEDKQGQNMKHVIEQTERMIPVMEEAFRKQLDNLYAKKKMEVSTEINVLENILKTEGLMKE